MTAVLDRTDSIDAAIERADTIAVIMSLPITDLAPDPEQARDEGADDELAASISANGFYPSKAIEVREHPHAGEVGETRERNYVRHPAYMIVDGERRYRAAVKAGLTHVPVTVTAAAENVGDRLLRQVVSNDGKRLKPMEEARTFKRIMADKGWNIQQLADHLGRAKSTVSDRVAIADVPAQFLEYFEKGQLTAAAAPIVRQLADLPERKLEAVAKAFGEDWNVEDAIADGKPVPLREVEKAIDSALEEEMREIAAVLEPDYKGKVVQVGKRKFAVDVAAYDALEKKRQASAPKAAAPAKREPSSYELKQRAEQKKAREKSELRRLQIRAISGKLPTSIGGSVNQADGWSMFLVRYLLREMTHDTQRSACKLLDLEPPKASAHQGYQFDKALLKHAEGLKAPARVQLALQLLLAHDMYCSPNFTGGGDRIAEAAKLTGVDLKKVVVADEKKAVFASAPAGKKTKGKGAKKRTPNSAFMSEYPLSVQLEAVVGAGPMVRTEVTKKLWQYIKRNGLQDKKERRMINADDKLKLVFKGKKQVSMFEMTKLINVHLKGYTR